MVFCLRILITGKYMDTIISPITWLHSQSACLVCVLTRKSTVLRLFRLFQDFSFQQLFIVLSFALLLVTTANMQSSTSGSYHGFQSNSTQSQIYIDILKFGVSPMFDHLEKDSPEDLKVLINGFKTVFYKCTEIVETQAKSGRLALSGISFLTITVGAAYLTWHIYKITILTVAEWQQIVQSDKLFSQTLKKLAQLEKLLEEIRKICENSILAEKDQHRLHKLLNEAQVVFETANGTLVNEHQAISNRINSTMMNRQHWHLAASCKLLNLNIITSQLFQAQKSK